MVMEMMAITPNQLARPSPSSFSQHAHYGTHLQTAHFLPTDTLPSQVRLQLCMNRQDFKLADGDGQLWTQLMSIYNGPGGVLALDEGNSRDINRKLAAALHLDGENATRLPNRLLIILRNEQWSRFTTLWCRTAIGRETFNTSRWISMIAHRLDHVSPALFALLSSSSLPLSLVRPACQPAGSARHRFRLDRSLPSESTSTSTSTHQHPPAPARFAF